MSTFYRFSIGTSNPGTTGVGLCFDYTHTGPRDDKAACEEATDQLERESSLKLGTPFSGARVYIDPELKLTEAHIVEVYELS